MKSNITGYIVPAIVFKIDRGVSIDFNALPWQPDKY